jgi:hypothetical protein
LFRDKCGSCQAVRRHRADEDEEVRIHF